jgi:mono/diheme cytochrome c family protein
MRPWLPLLVLACGDRGPTFAFPTCEDAGEDVVFDVTPTWDDVAPLLTEHCSACHQDGGSAPFSLVTYDEVRGWGRALANAVEERRMPPTGPTSCGECNTYRNRPWLTPEEIALVRTWVEADMPAGAEPAALTPASPPRLPRVDTVVRMAEPYTPKQGADDDFRCFVLDPGFDVDTFVTGFEVQPGDLRVVHHVILHAVTGDPAEATAADAADPEYGYSCFGGAGVDATMIAAWAPGLAPTAFPEGTGLRIPAGTPLIMEMHYNLAEGAHPDQSAVALRVAPEVAQEAELFGFFHSSFRIPGGEASVSSSAVFPLVDWYDDTITIWGGIAHMHTLGRQLRLEVWEPGEDEADCVMDVSQYDFNWQGLYFYEEPLVRKGSDLLRMTCTWDTRSVEGPLVWGDNTGDEMCVSFLYATAGAPVSAL